MTKRTCRRRTFAQIRAGQDRALARYLDHHADKLAASDQRESAAVVRGLASSIKAGLVESKGERHG